MVKQLALVFIIMVMLIACMGLQSTPAPTINYAASDTAYAEATLGTPNAYSMTLDAIGLTRTAYILSVPTLSAEERQVLRQTQDQLMATDNAYSTQYALNSTQHFITLTALAQGTDPYILTETLSIPTRTAETENRLTTVDDFSMTATWIIATATANAIMDANRTPVPYITATPCSNYAWTRAIFQYDERLSENGQENPSIREVTSAHCHGHLNRFLSHEILIYPSFPLEEFDTEKFYLILEDAVSRLPEYPPHQPEVSELIQFDVMEKGNWPVGTFTYSEAIAAYEQGLRGEVLAEVLGVRMPWPAP